MFASFTFRIARGFGKCAPHMISGAGGKLGAKAWSSPFSNYAQGRFFLSKKTRIYGCNMYMGSTKKGKLLLNINVVSFGLALDWSIKVSKKHILPVYIYT